jgi:hypothetical protein
MLRKIVRLVIDLAVIAACIACILHFSRRRSVECSWDKMRASCHVEVEDSLGRIEREDIAGIRSAAYRSGKVVALVTDAQHKSEHALFGTYEIQLDDDTAAEHLRAFAADHDPDHIVITSGVSRPRLFSGALLFALALYAFASHRLRRRSDLATRAR